MTSSLLMCSFLACATFRLMTRCFRRLLVSTRGIRTAQMQLFSEELSRIHTPDYILWLTRFVSPAPMPWDSYSSRNTMMSRWHSSFDRIIVNTCKSFWQPHLLKSAEAHCSPCSYGLCWVICLFLPFRNLYYPSDTCLLLCPDRNFLFTPVLWPVLWDI